MKKVLILFVLLLSTLAHTEKNSSTSKKSEERGSKITKTMGQDIVIPKFFEEAKNLSYSASNRAERFDENIIIAEELEFFQSGKASFYGAKWNGRKTANGEIFNTSNLTAAHKTLPFGTKVKVTNQSNGKSVVVRINDRGPYVKGRVIDLSTAAFSSIEDIGKGVTSVKIEIIK